MTLPNGQLARPTMATVAELAGVVFDGLPHAFWAYMDIPETTQANALMAKYLKDHLIGK